MDGIKRKLTNNEKEDGNVPATKKQPQSGLALNKKNPTKLILNREILEGIFNEIIPSNVHGHFILLREVKIFCKNVEKFMASGREPFNVALRYFRQVSKINVWYDRITMHNDKKIVCEFLYKNVFLKPILNAAGPTVKEFKYEIFSDEIDVDLIFDALFHDGTETVYICRSLSENNLLKLCNLTSLTKLDYAFTYSQLPLIRSRNPRLGLTTDFKELIKEPLKNFSMPWVKRLCINSHVEISDFTHESIKHFSKCISEIFPNIESFHVQFHCKTPTWKSAYHIMKTIEPHLFQSIPSTVKGSIHCNEKFDEMEYEEFYELTKDDNDYVLDIFHAERKFDIHKGFWFESLITC